MSITLPKAWLSIHLIGLYLNTVDDADSRRLSLMLDLHQAGNHAASHLSVRFPITLNLYSHPTFGLYTFSILHVAPRRGCPACSCPLLVLFPPRFSACSSFSVPLPISNQQQNLRRTWYQLSIMASSLSNMSPEELASYPALPPPLGILPNFDNAPNRNMTFLAVTSLLLGIMALFVLNRLYAKKVLIRKYKWDDCKSDELSWFSKRMTTRLTW